MTLIDGIRRDLARPERAVDREELRFLVPCAVLVVVAAQISEPGSATDLALIAVGGLALVARGLFTGLPTEVFALGVVVPISLAVGRQGNLEVALFLICTVTLYAAWHLGSTIRAMLIAVLATATILLVAAAVPDETSWPPWVAAEVFTLVLGRTLRRQEVLISQLNAAREGLAEQAVAEERRRIARELHDLSGHTLAAMLLHVTGARHVLHRDITEAEQALRHAEAVGRASMDQIRETVAALRVSERGVDPPLPSAGDLEELAAEYRRTGMELTATISPEVALLGGPVGLALHRIARESLANAGRHAHGNHVSLQATLDRSPPRVCLEIRDQGRRATLPDPAAGRFGLVGMQERARSLGGTLVAAPTDDGWCVQAELPLEPAADEAGRR